MKLYYYIFFFTFFTINSYGQDIIYLNNNEQIKAKVTRVEKSVIWYKKYDFLNGPEYKISTREIKLIVYENGTTEKFNDIKVLNLDSTRNNLISINLAALYVWGGNISYRRYLFKKKLSFKIPILFSQTSFLPSYSTGLDISLIPTPFKRDLYNVGIGARLGQFSASGNVYGYNYAYKNFWALYINNGFSRIITNRFTFSTQIGFGLMKIENESRITPCVNGDLSIGIRF